MESKQFVFPVDVSLRQKVKAEAAMRNLSMGMMMDKILRAYFDRA